MRAAEAQNRTVKKRAKTAVKKTTTTLKAPSSPTPLDIKERTIKDLLYFPFGCLPHEVNTPKEAMEQLTETFDMCEKINGYEGLHNNSTYDFTYLGVPIGLCYASRYDDNRQWYLFYFSSHANANSFYSKIVKDIKDAGIPLIRDNIYGGMSSAICELACQYHPCRVLRLGLQDVYPRSGKAAELLDAYGLAVSDIVRAAKDAMVPAV